MRIKKRGTILKRLWESLNRMVSAPLLCYVLLILLSFALIVIPLLFVDDGIACTIMTNFGYGIFGSTFVAALIDYGATIRKQESDRKEFFLLSKDLIESINNLVVFRRRYNHILPTKYQRLSYKEWIYKLEGVEFEFDGHKTSLFVPVKTHLNVILGMAEILDSKATILISNLSLPENFIYNLGNLILDLKMAMSAEKSDDNFALKLAIPDVFNNLSLLFPEYESLFCGEWENSKEDIVTKISNNK